MESTIEIKEVKKVNDYFPALFANKDRTVIILADERTSETTFSGMIIFANSKTAKTTLGVYSQGWTYQQFSRLVKETTITLNITQND